MPNNCGAVALDIRTYYAGLNQVTHPNVISFEQAWHGYKYYMAYTPYPFANGSEENPCLAASNDLLHWEKPDGLINPIACCEELECDELKDTHLVYRPDLDRLEIWYLGRKGSSLAERGPLYSFRKVSQDGISWSAFEEMYCFKDMNLASPTVIWNEQGYTFWGIRSDKLDVGFYRMTSIDGFNWSKLQKCEVPRAAETHMWHGAVSQHDGKYQFVWVGNAEKDKNIIYYSESNDGISFSDPVAIIENYNQWSYLYRPCILWEKGNWYCYYGVIRHDGKWMISMSSGQKVTQLQGLTVQQLGDTKQPLSELLASDKKMLLKAKLRKLSGMMAPRLLAAIPVVALLRLICGISPLTTWLCSVILTMVMSYMMIYRNANNAFKQGLLVGTVAAAFAEFISANLVQLLSWIR